jgi:plasmid maintenance system killer protein
MSSTVSSTLSPALSMGPSLVTASFVSSTASSTLSLRLHRQKGPLSELHSVSINISYRITMEFILNDRQIIPIDIGAHDDVYR